MCSFFVVKPIKDAQDERSIYTLASF